MNLENRILETNGFKKTTKYFNELQSHTYTCKCGHRVIITNRSKRALCNWCKNFVYKSKKEEFMDRLGVKLYGRKD